MRAGFALLMVVMIAGVSNGPAAGGSGTIQGRVLDAGTGQPVAFVNMIVRGTVIGSFTMPDGDFTIRQVPAGSRTLIASCIGYAPAMRVVQVEAGQTVNIELSLDPVALSTDEVVVTGTKQRRYIRDIPIRTDVLTRQAIEDLGAHDLYGALKGAPGVRVEQQCQACNFSQVRMLGLSGDHTQVLIDGQPLYSGLAGVYGLQQIGTASIERIEVIKGAGSSLYGSGAVAGAINLISRTPRSKPEANLTMELGQHRTQRYEFSASQRFGSTGILLHAQRNRGDIIDETGDGDGRNEVYRPDGISDRVRTDLISGGFSALFEETPWFDGVTLRGRTLHENRQGGELSNDSYEIADDVFENPFTAGTEDVSTSRFEGELAIRKETPLLGRISASVAYAHQDRNATNDTFLNDYEAAHGQLPPVDLLRPYLAEEKIWTGSLDLSKVLGGRHRILAGLQAARHQVDESGMYVVVDTESPGHGLAYRATSEKHATNLGVYLQDEFALHDRLEIVLGARFDHHSSEDVFRGDVSPSEAAGSTVAYDESVLNPRIAVRYNASDRVTVRATVGTGFRVPYGFSEDLHLCSGSPRVWKSAELQPEKSTSFTLSSDYYRGPLNGGITLYRVNVRDKVGLVDASDKAAARGYTYEWRNIDDAYVQGVELNCRWEISQHLTLDADGGISRGEYGNEREDWLGTTWQRESRHLSRLAQYTVGIKLEARPERWRLVGSIDLQGPMHIDYYKDGEEPSEIFETEAFFTADARVVRAFPGGISVFAGGRNLMNYVQERKRTDDAAFMYGPVYGRILYGGLSLDL